jgi:nucleoid DNA-binding protein
MQLSQYIKDLLYRYECVIVPGLGAFLTRYQSARIDEETQTFYPPGKILSFNRQLQTNDGILANYLASNENCSYETALQKIRMTTTSLSAKLLEGETISFDQIGELYLNSEQSVQFVPSELINFNTNSFGLAPFVSPVIIRESKEAKVIGLNESTPELSHHGRNRVYRYMKYAAIAVIAVSLSGIGGMKLYESSVQNHNYVERQKANTLIENQIQEATFIIDNPLPTIDLTVRKSVGKYHVIAGAFRVESNAYKKMSQLREKGYDPMMIGVNKYGLHQVAYRSFEDRNEANNALREIRRVDNADAWLLVQQIEE